jgi:hypothetical protein
MPRSIEIAATRAMIATKDSMSMPPYPMNRVCRSFSMSFGVVPEEMRAWKPERAPQAMVTKRNGNSAPEKTGPFSRLANSLKAGTLISGRTTMMATASMAITPIFMKVDR